MSDDKIKILVATDNQKLKNKLFTKLEQERIISHVQIQDIVKYDKDVVDNLVSNSYDISIIDIQYIKNIQIEDRIEIIHEYNSSDIRYQRDIFILLDLDKEVNLFKQILDFNFKGIIDKKVFNIESLINSVKTAVDIKQNVYLWQEKINQMQKISDDNDVI